jgi:hypothetical protein
MRVTDPLKIAMPTGYQDYALSQGQNHRFSRYFSGGRAA